MKFVVALGGNALSDAKKKGEPFEDQLEKIKNTAIALSQLIMKGHTLVITHGNGPQVGSLLLQQQADIEGSTNLPLNILGALSQSQIGVSLQHALINELRRLNVEKNVYVIPTSVIVDKNDQGFQNPTKPVGPFYSEEEYKSFDNDFQYIKKDDGYRRLVPSPQPMKVLEADLIEDLMNKDNIVICVGGGGSPTVDEGTLSLVDAVIDKDLASSLLARTIKADKLVILTNVNGVYSKFGTEEQKLLSTLTADEAKELLNSNSKAMQGSMGPKLMACVNFSDKGDAIITSSDYLVDAISSKAGTTITKNK